MRPPEIAARRPDLTERAAGMLAGVAVGDALGMPAEFLTPATITEWYGGISDLRRADTRHPHSRLPAGSITDDTDHTLLLAQLLLDDGKVTPRAWADRLLAWGRTERVRSNRFVGPSTLKSLEALEAGAALEDVPRGGTSCGAAMRLAALAIVFTDCDELEQQVVASCEVSHYTKSAISGAVSMAFALSEALEPDATVRSVAQAAMEGADRGLQHGDWSWCGPIGRRIEHVLAWAEELSEERAAANIFELIGVDLYADQLVPAALGLTALSGGHPNKGMLLAANLGGDADTLASMVGSLCGALAGVRAIEPKWLATVTEVNDLDLDGLAARLVELRHGRSN